MDIAYRRVADDLRQDINAGKYRPGDPIPSEGFLEKQYGLSRTTIRNAVKLLKAEGLVDTGSGRQTTVRQRLPRIRRDGTARYMWEKQQVANGGLPNDSHLAREVGLPPTGTELELLADELIAADHDLVAALHMRAMGQVRHYAWLLSADGMPGRIAHHYYPAALDEAVRASHPMNGITPEDPKTIWPGGTFYQLAQQGVEVARVDDLVTARMPLPEESDLLAMAEGVPLLVVRKTTICTEGLVREVVDVLMPADRAEAFYRIDLPRWMGGPPSLTDSDSD